MNALLLGQQWQDDTSIIGFDSFTIEVLNSVLRSFCSLKTWHASLVPLVPNQCLSRSDQRNLTNINASSSNSMLELERQF